MNFHSGWLIFTRTTARVTVIGVGMTAGCVCAWAQGGIAPGAGPEARRTELRTTVRQPQPSPSTLGKSVEARHLNAQERAELRRQLTRELRAQNAAGSQASRP